MMLIKIVRNILILTFFLLYLVSEANASSVNYVHTDHQGSVVELTDEQGNVAESERYYSYGEERYSDGDTSERKYTGQVKDSEGGLYYYNARYYDEKLSIFISPDQFSDEANRYIYVSGNPINRIDPTGNRPIADEYFTDDYLPPPQTGSSLTKFTGPNWGQNEMQVVDAVIMDVASKLAGTINKENLEMRRLLRNLSRAENIPDVDPADFANASAEAAFLDVFGGPVTFHKTYNEICPGETCWAAVSDDRLVRVTAYLQEDVIARHPNLIAHEVGHLFERALDEAHGSEKTFPAGQTLLSEQLNNPDYPIRGERGTEGYWGFATTYFRDNLSNPFQISKVASPHEEFADQFVGWTYDTWQMGESGEIAPDGEARAAFMQHYMPLWIVQIFDSR